jgi:chorismate mutase
MDGLMIEVHNEPKLALTDAFQQLDFSEFENLLSNLVEKNMICKHSELKQMRALVDDLDEELIAVLAKRMELVDEMGKYKHQHNITVLQMDRWKNMLENRLDFGRKNHLDDEFMLAFWRLVHAEALRIQNS